MSRYHAVMTPLNHYPSKKRTIYFILLIWSIAIALALPNIFLFEFKYIKDVPLGKYLIAHFQCQN